jgi:steroid 5-alpha reductase family enzyme
MQYKGVKLARSGGTLASFRPEGTLRAVKLVKRLLIALVIVFAVFYLVTRPQDAANAVQGAVSAVWGAGVAVTQFFGALVSG